LAGFDLHISSAKHRFQGSNQTATLEIIIAQQIKQLLSKKPTPYTKGEWKHTHTKHMSLSRK